MKVVSFYGLFRSRKKAENTIYFHFWNKIATCSDFFPQCKMPVLFSSTPSPLKGRKCWVSVSFAFKLAEVFGALGNTSLKEECKSFSISSKVYFHFPIITFISNLYITLRFSQPRIGAYCEVTVGLLWGLWYFHNQE